MSTQKRLSAEEFKAFLDGSFIGDPSKAREFCEKTMSPKFLRFQAGGDRTDFERAVEKVEFFRRTCRKWEIVVHFLVQEEERIAARLDCVFALGEEAEKKMELMFMATRDEEGRFENVWELSSELKEE